MYEELTLPPISATPESAAARVRRQLEQDINNAVYLPGDALDDRELMERFKVSRTPVRDAILQLAEHGLVTIVPRSGTYVARMSIQELLAMLEVLAELEASCAKLAARRMTLEDRETLVAMHVRARDVTEKKEVSDYTQYNAGLHGLIYAGCLNTYLAEQIRYIRRRTQIYRRNVFQEPRRMDVSYADHDRIVNAIVNGRSDDAYTAMHAHISNSGKDLLELLGRTPARLFESQELANPPFARPKVSRG
jgi:DNA-binding GntR family transcriptional regulator